MFVSACVHYFIEVWKSTYNKLSASGENGKKIHQLTTCTRSYLNFRALCSSHLQHPTHCAPRTPCAEEEGKERVNGGWVRRRGGGVEGGGVEGGETRNGIKRKMRKKRQRWKERWGG